MISVLLPTRGRYSRAHKAIWSLFKTAADPSGIELLVRTDDDMPALQEVVTDLPTLTELRGERWGYGRMHDYYNQLAGAARGELLFVWNDDTEMLTPRWDELLLSKLDEPRVQFIRRDTCPTADDTFPVIDRRIFEAAGSLARHCYVDTWLSRVSEAAGVRLFRNDIVFHHHRLQDEVQRDNERALTGPDGHVKFGMMDAERAEDVARIKKLLKERR